MMEQEDVSNEQIARELGVETTLLYKWRKSLAKQGKQAFPDRGNQAADDDELTRLCSEIKKLREERDVLRSAAAYFARELPPR